jgi:hypothetical protein
MRGLVVCLAAAAATERNVDTDQEGGDFPQFLTSCLRSR